MDWSKAFDTISPDGLADALRRFGVPDKFVRIIGSVYSGRQFLVSDFDSQSDLHHQAFGISQGCPLSPFLFVILMTVLIHDTREELVKAGHMLSDELIIHKLVYADDTLLIDVLGPNLQHYMDLIVQFGSQYGLSINWKKVEIMTVRCDAQISSADGKILDPKTSLAYLGATIHNSGVIDSELNRRLGMVS